MRAPSNAPGLSSRVDELLEQRQSHLDAAEKLSETIAQIERLLGVSATNGGPRRGRPPGRPSAPVAGPVSAPASGRGGKRTRQRFETSGEESIINFIRSNRNPTTQDVKKHWASEGRGGTADNALSKLVKDRKIKRIPLVGVRGSRYTA
jgi:hypothetical protein